MNKIFFDLDGTICNLYSVDNWLPMLIASDPTPYMIARPLVNLSRLACYLNKLQRKGYNIGIISWTSKGGSAEYNATVEQAKKQWLAKHLPSVKWDEIHIVPYGVNKKKVCGEGYLFDDEERNRKDWGKNAYEPEQIFNILKSLT